MAALDGYGTLVTGGGSGIGEGCAAALARDGASVTICGRTPEKLDAAAARLRAVAAPGAVIETIPADVTDEEQVQAAVAKAARATGHLHGVVASAGGSLHMGPLVLADVDAVRATVDLNVIGTMSRPAPGRSSACRPTPGWTRSASSARTAPPRPASTWSCASPPTSWDQPGCG